MVNESEIPKKRTPSDARPFDESLHRLKENLDIDPTKDNQQKPKRKEGEETPTDDFGFGS